MSSYTQKQGVKFIGHISVFENWANKKITKEVISSVIGFQITNRCI
jgi:hypothetical protein